MVRHLLLSGPAVFLCCALVGLSSPSWAVDLEQAKAQGLVGEQSDGYLGAIRRSPEVNALIASINAQRRAKYLEIAARNGAPLDVVEALAGKTAIDKTAAGRYIRMPGGQWLKK